MRNNIKNNRLNRIIKESVRKAIRESYQDDNGGMNIYNEYRQILENAYTAVGKATDKMVNLLRYAGENDKHYIEDAYKELLDMCITLRSFVTQ